MIRATLIFALLLAGCDSSEKAVLVTGTLLKDGKPYTISAQGLPPGDPGFRLGFHTLNPNGQLGESFFAVYAANDGTFEVPGPRGKGIPPGKYRISLQKGAMGRPDELKNVFSAEKSPLQVELPDASHAKIEADLDKKTVTLK
jgi:hypothetical protein